MVSWGSGPVADPDVLRVWGAGTGLDQLLQAHQERGPLRAAVGHELDRLAPALVLEQDDRVVALPLQVEADVGADPLPGPSVTSHSTRSFGRWSSTFMSNPPVSPKRNWIVPPTTPSPMVSVVHQAARPSRVVSASYTFSGAAVAPMRCRMSTMIVSLARIATSWLLSNI